MDGWKTIILSVSIPITFPGRTVFPSGVDNIFVEVWSRLYKHNAGSKPTSAATLNHVGSCEMISRNMIPKMNWCSKNGGCPPCTKNKNKNKNNNNNNNNSSKIVLKYANFMPKMCTFPKQLVQHKSDQLLKEANEPPTNHDESLVIQSSCFSYSNDLSNRF